MKKIILGICLLIISVFVMRINNESSKKLTVVVPHHNFVKKRG